MRIRISGIDTPIADEKRAYAEYRFFTSIAPYEPQIGAVDVVVGRELAARRQFLCAVTVDLGRLAISRPKLGGAPERGDRQGCRSHRLADRPPHRAGFSVKSSAFSS